MRFTKQLTACVAAMTFAAGAARCESDLNIAPHSAPSQVTGLTKGNFAELPPTPLSTAGLVGSNAIDLDMSWGLGPQLQSAFIGTLGLIKKVKKISRSSTEVGVEETSSPTAYYRETQLIDTAEALRNMLDEEYWAGFGNGQNQEETAEYIDSNGNRGTLYCTGFCKPLHATVHGLQIGRKLLDLDIFTVVREGDPDRSAATVYKTAYEALQEVLVDDSNIGKITDKGNVYQAGSSIFRWKAATAAALTMTPEEIKSNQSSFEINIAKDDTGGTGSFRSHTFAAEPTTTSVTHTNTVETATTTSVTNTNTVETATTTATGW